MIQTIDILVSMLEMIGKVEIKMMRYKKYVSQVDLANPASSRPLKVANYIGQLDQEDGVEGVTEYLLRCVIE